MSLQLSSQSLYNYRCAGQITPHSPVALKKVYSLVVWLFSLCFFMYFLFFVLLNFVCFKSNRIPNYLGTLCHQLHECFYVYFSICMRLRVGSSTNCIQLIILKINLTKLKLSQQPQEWYWYYLFAISNIALVLVQEISFINCMTFEEHISQKITKHGLQ